MASGATFIAQSVSSDIKQLTAIIQEAMNHKGFSFINVFSPCVTYNKVNTYDWFKENLTSLEDIEGYDAADRTKAMQTLMEHNGLVTGLIYQNKEQPSYQELIHGYSDTPLAYADLTMDREKFAELTSEFM